MTTDAETANKHVTYWSGEVEVTGPITDAPIWLLNLSVRSRKCTTKLNIRTVGELIQHTGEDLLECKNFGAVSLKEVREKLAEYGLKLKDNK
jgi:DNA-directed RNA polymerase subunit alpha